MVVSPMNIAGSVKHDATRPIVMPRTIGPSHRGYSLLETVATIFSLSQPVRRNVALDGVLPGQAQATMYGARGHACRRSRMGARCGSTGRRRLAGPQRADRVCQRPRPAPARRGLCGRPRIRAGRGRDARLAAADLAGRVAFGTMDRLSHVPRCVRDAPRRVRPPEGRRCR